MVVAPPYEVKRRAWECALVLREEFAGLTTLEQAIRAEVVLRAGPDALGWSECGDMFATYGAVAGVRV